MPRRRVVWKTEKLSSYTSRVASDTERTARQLLARGEVVLQKRVRHYTPRDSGRLWSSIQTEHKGRYESVRASMGGGALFAAPSLPGASLYGVRERVLEGSVYSDLPWASDVEYDTGIYNHQRGGRPITPTTKKALAFTTKGGKAIVVASVKGYPGKHMFSKGAAYVNSSPRYLQNQSAAVLSKWRARNMIVRPR